MNLSDYPEGTRVRIGQRVFSKTNTRSFWREEHCTPGNCVSRPSVSLESIEQSCGEKHVLIEPAQ